LNNIGDRGVRTVDDAAAYIEQGPMAMVERHGHGFCLVALRGCATPIGICGIARRDYLDDPDIGFAFLPAWHGKGYAFEAAHAVLQYAAHTLRLPRIVATTRPSNHASARLLGKLGLAFERMIPHPDDSRELMLFSLDLDEDEKKGRLLA
jgi:RimJ/RimL family protein N-acetyltransferase